MIVHKAAGQVLLAWWSTRRQDRYYWPGGQQRGRTGTNGLVVNKAALPGTNSLPVNKKYWQVLMACRSTKCNKAVRQPIMALLFNKVAGEKLMARRSTKAAGQVSY